MIIFVEAFPLSFFDLKKIKKEWDSGAEYLHKRYNSYEQALFAWKKTYKFK